MPRAETVPGFTDEYIYEGGVEINPIVIMDLKPTLYPAIEDTLSADRFSTYLSWSRGDRDKALQFYTLNARLCESLYTPLHMLEVALRNRIHQVMTVAHGPIWYELEAHQANPVQLEMLTKARQDMEDAKKTDTPGRMVAALTFGYWTAMLGKEYENLWQTTLKDIARREDGKGLTRKAFSKPLAPIRTLRNRIAHHEPILYWTLPKHHDAILQLTAWLSPVAAQWSRDNSRFAEIHPAEGIDLHKTAVTEECADENQTEKANGLSPLRTPS
jgi:Abi-like protein